MNDIVKTLRSLVAREGLRLADKADVNRILAYDAGFLDTNFEE